MTEFETTTFVNIDDKEFIGYFGNEPYSFKAGESREVVKFVAQNLAKHLIDRILQEKYGVHNTLADTPVRKELLAKILPKEAEIANYKPLTQEEKEKALNEVLDKQADVIKTLSTKTEHLEEKLGEKNVLEKKVQDLEEQLQKLLVKVKPSKKMGRPRKTEVKSSEQIINN
jgi:small-conductance mechanosensitive channel